MFGCGNVLYIEMSVHYPCHNMLSDSLIQSTSFNLLLPGLPRPRPHLRATVLTVTRNVHAKGGCSSDKRESVRFGPAHIVLVDRNRNTMFASESTMCSEVSSEYKSVQHSYAFYV